MNQNPKIKYKLVFIVYLIFLFYFLLLSDWYGRDQLKDYSYNLVLGKEIFRYWFYRDTLGAYLVCANLLGNVLIFIPLGTSLMMSTQTPSLLYIACYSFSVSLVVEIFQLICKVGSFDVDDILLNTLGGVIGFAVYVVWHRNRRRYDQQKKQRK